MAETDIPSIVTEVQEEISPGDLPYVPENVYEYLNIQRTKVALKAWEEQQGQERDLRKKYAFWVFCLITGQIILIFIIIFLVGLKCLVIPDIVINVLIPSVVTEVFGMGYLVVKYLFTKPVKELQNLLENNLRE